MSRAANLLKMLEDDTVTPPTDDAKPGDGEKGDEPVTLDGIADLLIEAFSRPKNAAKSLEGIAKVMESYSDPKITKTYTVKNDNEKAIVTETLELLKDAAQALSNMDDTGDDGADDAKPGDGDDQGDDGIIV